MKKTIIMTMAVSLFFQVGGVFAQKKKVKVESPEVKAEVEKLISSAEANIERPYKLNEVMYEFSKNRAYKKHAGTKLRRDVTIRLIKIYNLLNDVGVNQPNKERIIEAIGMNDNSPEAHKFFLDILENGPNKYRERVLWSLSPKGVHGDDIYDEIKKLMEKGVVDIEKFLYALKKANPQRALPEIQKIASTTKNPKLFQMAGRLLCQYKDVDLLDIIVERYNYFKNIPKDKQPDHYNPVFSFSRNMLEKYIEVKEGGKLKKALEIYNDRNIFGKSRLPLMQKKLKSKNIITREAVIDFLIQQIKTGSVRWELVIPILKEAEFVEINFKLKKKLKDAIKRYSGRLRGK